MTFALILSLVAIAALYARRMANIVKNDGYGRHSSGRTPPRKPHPELFDPTRTA